MSKRVGELDTVYARIAELEAQLSNFAETVAGFGIKPPSPIALNKRLTELEASERELHESVRQAEATVAVLSEMLEEVQWAAGYLPLAKPEPCCPVCHVSPDSIGGHQPECRLLAALADLPAAAREHLARDAEREQALRGSLAGLDALLTTPSRGSDYDKAIGVAKEARVAAHRALEPPDA